MEKVLKIWKAGFWLFDHIFQRQTDTEEQNMEEKPDLFTKLLAYLDKSSFSSAPSARNLDNLNMETPGGRQVGLENVQSRTSEAGVTVQKKDAAQQLEEVSEVHGWIKDVAPPPAALVYDDPHKKTLQVPELQLDVKEEGGKKADEDVFGYVITDTDGLQTDEGLHLMEILAHMAKIQMTDFAELSLKWAAHFSKRASISYRKLFRYPLVEEEHDLPPPSPKLSCCYISPTVSNTAGTSTFHLSQELHISIILQQMSLNGAESDLFNLIHRKNLSFLTEVVGPAVTFKVSPNRQNVSTTDVANVAEKETAHYHRLAAAPEPP
ncbi:hypothetical protein JOQ06_001873 [Pogonophryne albipinna]|uniref:Protein-tyrosine phosphatase receptor IA-2 ectodomain domain-containing protein n=1 Tax=Pogonophryne albipinna TaxID=1090488 RepID=A0AAD6B6T1_9TELE|nr:hypothetical protein JOQ06_001873 [Pogonophryne albipinna]